jgi:TonB-linked SusC/RagA family outer membrane protein
MLKLFTQKQKVLKIGSLLLLFICTQQFAFGQAKLLKGIVTDDKGTTIPGVNVSIIGSNKGTSTDAQGKFTIEVVPSVSVLRFSLMGFGSQDIKAPDAAILNVVLKTSVTALNEVVVVGYGTQKKIDLTGSVSVIQGQELAKRPVASTSLALQGIAPGVTITQQSGLPGDDGGTIRIRGIGSYQAGQDPLVLVDNIEMSLDAIDANNIQSISVLKDAAAAAIYGSRAANGVILITTKRGSAKGTSIQYNAYGGFQRATNMPQKVDALDHMNYYNIAAENVGQAPVYTQQITDYKALGPDNFSRFNTDWEKLVLTNNGFMQSHNVSISSGTDKIKVFASGSLLDQNGLTQNTSLQRKDFRFNTDIELAKNLQASMDMTFNQRNRDWPGGASPYFIILQAIGLPANVAGKFNNGDYGEAWINRNPIAQENSSGFDNNVTNTHVIAGTLTYKPIDGLSLVAFYSSNSYSVHERNLIDQYQVYSPDVVNNVLVPTVLYPSNNSLSDGIAEFTQNIFRGQATYTKSIRHHNFSALAGFSTEQFNTDNVSGYRANLLDPGQPYLSAGDVVGQTVTGNASAYTLASAFGRITYNYWEKYLFELNGRWDASSRFQQANWWQLFPSISGGWRMSQESFWEPLRKVINDSKLRVSYGSLGNQDVGSYYPSFATFLSGNNYYFNNSNNSGYALTQGANSNIQWETSTQFDAGWDMSFFDSRLTLTADVYQRDIKNMLQTIPVPGYVGLSAPYVNAGSMRNRGWELALGLNNHISDFKYQVQLAVSDVVNVVTNLNGQQYISGNIITTKGSAINSYYGYVAQGIFQTADQIKNAPFQFANTVPGDIRYKDISGPNGKPDGKIDNYDRVVLGNNIPRYTYSLNLASQWKGFDLTVFFQGVGKSDNYISGMGAQPFYSGQFQGTMYQYQKDFWTPANPNAAYPRLTINNNNNYVASSYWIKPGAYLRLKNAVLGYTLPNSVSSKVKVGSIRLYVSGQNLFTWDKFYPGFDPEIANNSGQFYPIMKTYTFGMNVKF